jgi:type I restriction enzyme S subunit
MPSYTRSECVVFCKTDETFGAFSNMAGGFPLYLGGQYYSTSEHLYQCLRFPQYPIIQEEIRQIRSPMGAKMSSKKYRADHSRSDWEEVCVDVMRFCLRLKLRSYEVKLGRLLRQSEGKLIVEESRRNTNDKWSARTQKDKPEILVGENTLGVLLMELRDEFLSLSPGEKIERPDAGWLMHTNTSIAA